MGNILPEADRILSDMSKTTAASRFCKQTVVFDVESSQRFLEFGGVISRSKKREWFGGKKRRRHSSRERRKRKEREGIVSCDQYCDEDCMQV
jgi:hypothetical protein